jgi:hypothetical protein
MGERAVRSKAPTAMKLHIFLFLKIGIPDIAELLLLKKGSPFAS